MTLLVPLCVRTRVILCYKTGTRQNACKASTAKIQQSVHTLTQSYLCKFWRFELTYCFLCPQNMRVRTVKGEDYQCRTGTKFHGGMEQKFILVDCHTVMYGSYRWTQLLHVTLWFLISFNSLFFQEGHIEIQSNLNDPLGSKTLLNWFAWILHKATWQTKVELPSFALNATKSRCD